MKAKKIIFCLVSVLILFAIIFNKGVEASSTLNPNLYFGIAENDYATAKGTTFSKIMNFKQFSTASGGTEISNPAINLNNAFCARAGRGFYDTNGNFNSSVRGTYNKKYKLNTEKTACKNDGVIDTFNSGNDITILNSDGTKNVSTYNAILALADLMYLDGADNKAKLVKDAITYYNSVDSTVFGYMTYDELVNAGKQITDDQLRAIQQAALWTFTNRMTDASVTDTSYDLRNITRILRDKNGLDWYSQIQSSDKDEWQSRQADAIYKYLVNTAINNASTYNNSTYPAKNDVYLYTNSGSIATTQPIIVIIPHKEFDLALRKYITKVNDSDLTESREPNIDIQNTLSNSTSNLTTASYKHRKDPVRVGTFDLVTYSITIYNEGDQDGKAIEIKDQLPDGIQFDSSLTINPNYNFSYDTSTNLLTITAKNTLRNLNKFNGDSLDSTTIDVVCRVVEEPDEVEPKVLTNIAWISKAYNAELDEEVNINPYSGTEIGHDRDSAPGNYPKYTKNGVTRDYTSFDLRTEDLGYTGKNKITSDSALSSSTTYFEGEQDDDDFEKIIIMGKRGLYHFYIVKTDMDWNPINAEAKFTVNGVEKSTNADTGILKYTGNGPVVINSGNVGQIDEYVIEETQAPAGYNKYQGKFTVKVSKSENADAYFASSIEIVDSNNNNVTTGQIKREIKNGDIYIYIPNYQYDLALRKFITKVTYNDGTQDLDRYAVNDLKTAREPKITDEEKTKLSTNTATYDNGTTLAKTHSKQKVGVAIGDKVTYTIRVYNEGETDGYAKEVTDYLPDGLDFLPTDQTNVNNGWHKVGNNDKVIATSILSLEDNTLSNSNKLLNKFNKSTKALTYRDLKIVCQVNENATADNLKNIAEITAETDEQGNTVVDRDSYTNPPLTAAQKSNYNPGTSETGKGYEDDDDYEDLRIIKFDLALRKYITKVTKMEGSTEIELSADVNGRTPHDINKDTITSSTTTAEYYHKKNPVEVNKDNFVYYNITIYNEGDIDGYASIIKDQLPAGLQYEGIVNPTTSKFTAIQPGDDNLLTLTRKNDQGVIPAYDGVTLSNETVSIKCKVISNEKNKILTNLAWIAGDYNATNTSDRDSQPELPTVHPSATQLVKAHNVKEYLGSGNDSKDWTDANEYFKGQQDDDDFEKIIIYDEPDIHKGVKTIKNQDSGYDDNEDEAIDEKEKHDWIIHSSLPLNIGNYKKYVVTDDIDWRLIYQGIKEVSIVNEPNADGTYSSVTTLTENTDYVLSYTPNSNGVTNKTKTGTLKLTFIDKQNGRNPSAKITSNAGKKIQIRFNTTFRKDNEGNILAEIIGKDVPNQAKLEYKNINDEIGEKETETPEVHTGGITLYKYYNKNNEKIGLKDAEFTVYKSIEDANTKQNGIQTTKSDANGFVAFRGLQYGDDAKDNPTANLQTDGTYKYDSSTKSKKYWIVETKEPEGYYTTVTTPIEVTINNSSYTGELSVLIREEESKENPTRLVENKPYIFDLALRKFITKIVDKKGNERDYEYDKREPDIKAEEETKLSNKNATFDNGSTLKKEHTKQALEVEKGDSVVYKIRIYNEGECGGYAKEVTDHLPDGLLLKENSNINNENGWYTVGNNAKEIATTKLNGTLIPKFVPNTTYWVDLEVECVVDQNTDKKSLKNVAEITESEDEFGRDEDVDSYTNPPLTSSQKSNYNPGTSENGKGYEDDDDYEDLKIVEFDLALRKYITKVEDENGKEIDILNRNPNIDTSTIATVKTATYKHRKDPVVVEPGYFVYYNLTVYNEGDVEGYAKQITDTLPAGVEYVDVIPEKKEVFHTGEGDTKTYVDTKYYDKKSYDKTTNILVLSATEDIKNLNPFTEEKLDSVTVTIKCKVVADKEEDADKIYTNIAWISEDYNEKDLDDRDSKPSEHPECDTLVTSYNKNGYVGNEENVSNELSNPNYYFKGKQDDDDFEKIIIYKSPDIHKGVDNIKNQDSGYDDNEDDKTAEEEAHKWIIHSSLPVNIDSYKEYKIVDDIDYRLVYLETNEVNIIDNDGKMIKNLVEGTDYRLEYTPNKQNVDKVSEILGEKYSGTLKLTFIDNENGINISDNLKTNAGNKIEVKFTTRFAKDDQGKLLAQIIGIDIPNKARLEYKNIAKKFLDTEKPEVHTGGITLFKYYEKDGKRVGLEGAKFAIFETEDDAKNKKNAILTSQSDKNGFVRFAGLQYGDKAIDDPNNKTAVGTYEYDSKIKSKKYWVVETFVPKKYEMVTTDPIEVEINKDSYQTEIETVKYQVENKPLIFDLALRKFITKVEDKTITTRVPKVKYNDGKISYDHTKEPVDVINGNIVTYTLRIFNEGKVNGYASVITDDIPKGLQFVPDNKVNKEYRWVMYEELADDAKIPDGANVVECKVTGSSKVKKYIETSDVTKAKIVRTDYLSKEQGEARMEKDNSLKENPNLLKAFDENDEITDINPDYKDIQVAFKVTEKNGSKKVLINYAQISDDTDEDGDEIDDIDSIPDRWNEGEDDQDIEKVRLPLFDLALRKWVTQAIVIENGKTKVTKTGHDAWDDPEEIVKVELHRKKLSNVTVKFRYSIRVYNQGEIEGYAKEITDYIPQGLKFIAKDNPQWKDKGNNVITTDQLKNTLLKPGESADVEVLLTWVNDKNNMGLKVNTAEISKDYNEKGVPDKDSTPNNKKPGEDDIDDAPVMLSISTGSEVTYYVLGLGILVLIAGGIFLIKKYVL